MGLGDVLSVLYEDNHCLAVNKPAGWPTTHYTGHEDTVDLLVKDYLKEKYAKAGAVYLGVIHRLDKPVTGVLLFARTSKAASRLCDQFRQGMVEKTYWAIVRADRCSDRRFLTVAFSGLMEDRLLRDEQKNRTIIVSPETANSKTATLFYHVRGVVGDRVWLELRPHTGRKHQLRAQLSARGLRIIGDQRYGSSESLGGAIALHARSLTFLHPTRREPITLTAPLPRFWGRFTPLMRDASYEFEKPR